MNARRIALLAGLAALAIGLIALIVPVSTSDGNGGAIGCGNGISADLSAARDANNHSVAGVPILNQVVPHRDTVAECQSAVSTRRAWAIPVAVVGLLVAAGSAATGARIGSRGGSPEPGLPPGTSRTPR